MNEEKKLNPTPGPWRAFEDRYVTGASGVCVADCMSEDITDIVEEQSNSQLVAEAGTVFHETGLTPRELAEQRAELLAVLQEFAESYPEGDLGINEAMQEGRDAELIAARAAIANATKTNG